MSETNPEDHSSTNQETQMHIKSQNQQNHQNHQNQSNKSNDQYLKQLYLKKPSYVSTLPDSYQLLIYSAGVFFFFLIFGYTQEWLFSEPGFKKFGWYLTLVQFLQYTFFAWLENLITERTILPERKPTFRTFTIISLLTVITLGCSNTSLGYLNYPTQVIFKSCKLIPVMIGAVLIQSKRFNFVEIFSVFCVTIGLIFFVLADVSVNPTFDPHGVLLICTALVADAVIGNVQEKTMRDISHISNAEMVFYSYLLGFIYIFFGLALCDGFVEPFVYCHTHPRVYGLITMYSLSGYLGLQFVLAIIRKFGSLVTVIVTSMRKTLSIVVSFMFFSKPFTMQYVWSGMVVSLGIFLNLYGKKYYNRGAMRDTVRKKNKQKLIFGGKSILTTFFQRAVFCLKAEKD